MIPIHELKRRLPHGVMAARQHDNLVIDPPLAYPRNGLLRKFRQKSSVVCSVNEFRLLPCPRELVHIVRRTDRHPHLAQLLEPDLAFYPLANMLRRKPGPHHVRHIGRAMVEPVHRQPLVMRAREKSVARSTSGPSATRLIIALPLQPIMS